MATENRFPELSVWTKMPWSKPDGTLQDNANLYMDEFYQTLAQVVDMFNDGMQIANKTTIEITAYRDDLIVPVGTMWFDTDIAKLKVKTLQAVYNSSGVLITPGTIETIQSI